MTYLNRSRARRRHWRHEHFDLVHLHYVNRFTDALTPLPRPLVVSVHDVFPHVPRLNRRAERALLTRIYRRADALVVHHPRLGDRLRSEFGIMSSRVFVVPHQVFPTGPVPTQPPDGPPSVLFFGSLRPNKGLDVLGDAIGLLPNEDLRFTIAGRGDQTLETWARALAERDRRVSVELGFATLERKRELFAAASLVVLPYASFSSQSGVLHDAYGHGRPVVVTDVGALGDTVREDGTGLVIGAGDARALAEAIRRSLVPELWEQHARRARLVTEARSPTAVGVRLREVYDEVLA